MARSCKDGPVSKNLATNFLPPLNPDDQDHVEQYGGEVDVEDEKVYCTPPLVPPVLEPWGVEVEIPGGGRCSPEFDFYLRNLFLLCPPASIFHPTTSWGEDYLSDTNCALSPPNCATDKM